MSKRPNTVEETRENITPQLKEITSKRRHSIDNEEV